MGLLGGLSPLNMGLIGRSCWSTPGKPLVNHWGLEGHSFWPMGLPELVTACAGLAAQPAAPPPSRSGGGPRGSRLQAPTGSPPHDAFTTLAYFRGLLVVLAAAAGKGGLTS